MCSNIQSTAQPPMATGLMMQRRGRRAACSQCRAVGATALRDGDNPRFGGISLVVAISVTVSY